MRSPLLLLASLALLSLGSAAAFDFPDCEKGPLSGTPICDESLPYMERARWLVSKMNVTEKVIRLQNGAPAIERLGLPAYEWWSEALHGLAWSPGVTFNYTGVFNCSTSFPEPIGLGATFDRQLIHDAAMTTSTEGRAFSNNGMAGLDFWTPNINIFRSVHQTRTPNTSSTPRGQASRRPSIRISHRLLCPILVLCSETRAGAGGRRLPERTRTCRLSMFIT